MGSRLQNCCLRRGDARAEERDRCSVPRSGQHHAGRSWKHLPGHLGIPCASPADGHRCGPLCDEAETGQLSRRELEHRLERHEGGGFVVNFRYIGSGEAIAAVLHAEEYGPNFDFAGPRRERRRLLVDCEPFHRLWIFDLDAHSAVPVSGIDAFPFVNPGFFHATIDGRQ